LSKLQKGGAISKLLVETEAARFLLSILRSLKMGGRQPARGFEEIVGSRKSGGSTRDQGKQPGGEAEKKEKNLGNVPMTVQLSQKKKRKKEERVR